MQKDKKQNKETKSHMKHICAHIWGPIYVFILIIIIIIFAFSRAAPVAYGDSQARGLIGAVATGLRQSHSNAGSLTH